MARIGVLDLPHAKASANAAFDDFQQVSHYEIVWQTVIDRKADGRNEAFCTVTANRHVQFITRCAYPPDERLASH